MCVYIRGTIHIDVHYYIPMSSISVASSGLISLMCCGLRGSADDLARVVGVVEVASMVRCGVACFR